MHLGRKAAKDLARELDIAPEHRFAFLVLGHFGAEQFFDETPALFLERAAFLLEGVGDHQVGPRLPPLRVEGFGFGDAPLGEQLVDVGHDDVANLVLGTADGAQAAEVSLVFVGLDLFPIELFWEKTGRAAAGSLGPGALVAANVTALLALTAGFVAKAGTGLAVALDFTGAAGKAAAVTLGWPLEESSR
jgi:hypothetical protein